VTFDRFDRFLPLAGVLIGLLFFAGLALTWGDPSSETAPAETFSYWQDNRGRHQISGLLLSAILFACSVRKPRQAELRGLGCPRGRAA
jgi:hypothetical protein